MAPSSCPERFHRFKPAGSECRVGASKKPQEGTEYRSSKGYPQVDDRGPAPLC